MPAYRLLFPALVAAFIATGASAQDDGSPPPADPSKTPPALASAVALLHPQQGKITIGDGLATIDLPPELSYLPPDQTDTFMHSVVHYSGQIHNLGAIVPAKVGIGSPASWFALIRYQEDGRVDDRQPVPDKAVLMSKIMDASRKRNEELKKKGYSIVGADIEGWAEPPHIDTTAHAFSWAVQFQPHNQTESSINYNVRALGRHGMITMMIFGKLVQLPMIQASGDKLLSEIKFISPNRYEDFVSGDKIADYSVADIILGDASDKNASPSHVRRSPKGQYLLSTVILAGVILLYRLRKRKRSSA